MNDKLQFIYEQMGGDTTYGNINDFTQALGTEGALDFVYNEMGGDETYGNINDFSNAIGVGSAPVEIENPDLGYRNNNPLNLRPFSDDQPHMTSEASGDFRVFNSPEEGLEANKKDLNRKITGTSGPMKTYLSKIGKNHADATVEDLINVWAPPGVDNNKLEPYLKVLEKEGVARDTNLQDVDIDHLALAMMAMESPDSRTYFDSGATGKPSNNDIEVEGNIPDSVFEKLDEEELVRLKAKAQKPVFGDHSGKTIRINNDSRISPNTYEIYFPDGTRTTFLDTDNANMAEEAFIMLENTITGVAADVVDVVGMVGGAVADAAEGILGYGVPGVDKLYDNAVRDFAQTMEESLAVQALESEDYQALQDEETGSFLKGANKFITKMGHAEFWIEEAGEGLESMISLMAPALVAGKAVAATKLPSKIAKLTGLSEKAAGNVVKILTADQYMSSLEAGMEAKETFKKAEEHYLANGSSEEEARTRAGEHASEVFGLNYVTLMASNAVELMAIGTPFLKSWKQAIPGITGSFASEAAQEAVQFGIETQAEEKIEGEYDESKLGLIDNPGVALDALSTSWKGIKEGNDSAISAIGIGGLMGGGAATVAVPSQIRTYNKVVKPIREDIVSRLIHQAEDIYIKDEDGKPHMVDGIKQIDGAKLLGHYKAIDKQIRLNREIAKASNINDRDASETLFTVGLAQTIFDYKIAGVDQGLIDAAIDGVISKEDYAAQGHALPFEEFKAARKQGVEIAGRAFNEFFNNPEYNDQSLAHSQELYFNTVLQEKVLNQINKLKGEQVTTDGMSSAQKAKQAGIEGRIATLELFQNTLEKEYTTKQKKAKKDKKAKKKADIVDAITETDPDTAKETFGDTSEFKEAEAELSEKQKAKRIELMKAQPITSQADIEAMITSMDDLKDIIGTRALQQLEAEREKAGSKSDIKKRYENRPLLKDVETSSADDIFELTSDKATEAFLARSLEEKLTEPEYKAAWEKVALGKAATTTPAQDDMGVPTNPGPVDPPTSAAPVTPLSAVDKIENARRKQLLDEEGHDPDNPQAQIGANRQARINAIHEKYDDMRAELDTPPVQDTSKPTKSKTKPAKQPSEAEIWNTFIDTGKIPQSKVDEIANKIIKGEPLTDKELSMRSSYAKEIESILNSNSTKQPNDVDDVTDFEENGPRLQLPSGVKVDVVYHENEWYRIKKDGSRYAKPVKALDQVTLNQKYPSIVKTDNQFFDDQVNANLTDAQADIITAKEFALIAAEEAKEAEALSAMGDLVVPEPTDTLTDEELSAEQKQIFKDSQIEIVAVDPRITRIAKYAANVLPAGLAERFRAGLIKLTTTKTVGKKITFEREGEYINALIDGVLIGTTYDRNYGDVSKLESTVKEVGGTFMRTANGKSRLLSEVEGLNDIRLILPIGEGKDVTYIKHGKYPPGSLDLSRSEVKNNQGFVFLMLKRPDGKYKPFAVYTPNFSQLPEQKAELLKAIEEGDNKTIKKLVKWKEEGVPYPKKITKSNKTLIHDGTAYSSAQALYDALEMDTRPIQITKSDIKNKDSRDNLIKILTSDLGDAEFGSFYHSPKIYATTPVIPESKTNKKKFDFSDDSLLDDDPLNDKFSEGEKENFVQESDSKALAWFKKRFPQVPYEISDAVIKILYDIHNLGNAKIWGAFTQSAVVLASARPEGTTFHEAFHVAFNLFASPSERVKLYTLAQKKWGAELNISAKELQEQLALSNESPSGIATERGTGEGKTSPFSDVLLKLEEKMAEEYAMLSINEGYPQNDIQKGLLKRLYDFLMDKFGQIRRLFTDPTIDQFFELIDRGTVGRTLSGKPRPIFPAFQGTKLSTSKVTYYEGDIVPEKNTVFVFGSNPEGRHGAGAAKIAKDQFGAKYGQGEGLQGNAFAIPTKDLRVKENKGFKSISPKQITESIKSLYNAARQNPNKQFKVAYRNTTQTSLSGYTGLEMIAMFNDAGNTPSNVIFSKEWTETGLIGKMPTPNSTPASTPNSTPRISGKLDEFTRLELKRKVSLVNKDVLPLLIKKFSSGKTSSLHTYLQEFKPKDRIKEIYELYEVAAGYLEAVYEPSYKRKGGTSTDTYSKVYTRLRKELEEFDDSHGSLLRTLLLDLSISHGVVLENINFTETEMEEFTEAEREDWQLQYTSKSPFENFSGNLKFIISNIPKIVKGKVLKNDVQGVEYLDAAGVFNSLIDNVGGSTSLQEMQDKLQELAKYKPWVNMLIGKLDENGMKQLASHLAYTQKVPFFTTMMERDLNGNVTLKVIESNRANIVSGMISDFKTSYQYKFLKGTEYEVTKINKLKKLITVVLNNPDFAQRNTRIYESLLHFGIDVDMATVEALDTGDQEIILQSILNIAEHDGDPFAVSRPRWLEITMKSLFVPLAKADQNSGLLSFKNVKGKRVYVNLQSNWMWRTFNRLTASPVEILKDENGNAIDEEGNILPEADIPVNEIDQFENYVGHRKAPIYQWFKDGIVKLEMLDGYKDKQGVAYADSGEAQLSVTNMNTWLGSRNTDNTSRYVAPTLAEAPVSYYMRLPTFGLEKETNSSSTIYDQLTKVVLQERDRITVLRNSKTGIDLYDKKGVTYQYFSPKEAALLDKTQDPIMLPGIIEGIMNTRYEAYELKLINDGVLVYSKIVNKKTKVVSYQLDPSDMLGKQWATDKDTDFKTLLKTYHANQTMANTQMMTLFSDDPSFYKSPEVYQKRAKQTHAPGVYGTWEKESYGVLYLADIELASEELVKVRKNKDETEYRDPKSGKRVATEDSTVYKYLTGKGVSKGLAQDIANNYANASTTDAQAYHSLERRKEIETAYGTWTVRKEKLYQRLLNGEEIPIEDEIEFLEPLKPHVFTKIKVEGSDGSIHLVPVQHKNSEITLLPSMIKGNETLEKLNDILHTGEINTVMFDTAVKVGGYNIVKWEDVDTTDLSTKVHIIKNEDWKKQNEVPPHALDTSNRFGTQKRKIVMSNILPSNTYEIDGKLYDGLQIKAEFEDLFAGNLSESLDALKEKLGINSENRSDKLQKLRIELIRSIEEEGLGSQFIEALDIIDKKGTEDFVIPLWHPAAASKLEPILNNYFKDSIKQRFNGGSYVNVSSFGYDDAKIVYKKDGDNLLAIDYVEVYLPAYAKDMIGENIDGLSEKLREGIVYRIPTEAKYSMFPIKIKGFLPTEMSGAIIMPREVSVIAGLDFDIDKVYAMFYHMQRDQKGELVKTPSENTTVKGRDNSMLDIMSAILKSEHHLAEFLEPGSFSYLTDLRETLNLTHVAEFNISDPAMQNIFANRNLVGARMIGILANDNVFHALIQGRGVQLTTPIAIGNKLYHNLSEFKKDPSNEVAKDRAFAILLAAAVDNAKDPVLGDLNINQNTANVLSLMIHIGVDMKTAIAFVNNPIIREYSNFADRAAARDISSPVAEFRREKNIHKNKNDAINLLSDADILSMKGDPNDVFNLFALIQDQAYDVNTVIQASRIDSGTAGPSMLDIDVLYQKYKKAIRSVKLKNVKNILPVMDKDFNITRQSELPTQDGFMEIIGEEMKYASEFFPYFTDSFQAIKDGVLSNLPRGKSPTSRQLGQINSQIINILSAHRYTFPTSTNPNKGFTDSNNFISRFPGVYEALKQNTNKKEHLAQGGADDATKLNPNRFSDLFAAIENIDIDVNDFPFPILAIKRGESMTSETISTLKDAFSELYRGYPKMANLLISYTFHLNGLHFNKRSFSHLIPIEYYQDNPISLNTNIDPIYMKGVISNIVRSNPSLLGEIGKKPGATNGDLITLEDPPLDNDGVNPVDYLTYKDEIYYRTSGKTYQKQSKLGVPGFIREYTLNSRYGFNGPSPSAQINEAKIDPFDPLIPCG